MAITKNESYWHNSSVQSIGVMALLLLVLRLVIHRSEGPWTGTDWTVLTLGVLVALAWCAWTVVRVIRHGRRRSEPDRGSSSTGSSAAAPDSTSARRGALTH